MCRLGGRLRNYAIITVLTVITFSRTFLVFHMEFMPDVVLTVILARIVASSLLFRNYAIPWSKATRNTFFIKFIVYFVAMLISIPFLYDKIDIGIILSEFTSYVVLLNIVIFGYHFFARKRVIKTKEMVIYGAGVAGMTLWREMQDGPYKLSYFVDDDKALHGSSIDGVEVISKEVFLDKLERSQCGLDLLVIALPSAPRQSIRELYNEFQYKVPEIKILPSVDEILLDTPYSSQLKKVSIADLLARYPRDLDTELITDFIEGETVLITGAGGSIGSEIARQCVKSKAKQLILLDHSEYNLYKIEQELVEYANIVCAMQSVVNKTLLRKTCRKYKPNIIIHAAAYKHVPLVEANVEEAVLNNIVGTKNCIDIAIESRVKKFVFISTDKAVRPTNVMGTTKRVCELYAQNVESNTTEIVSVRFGNVLGSSGSVIPKFRAQIEAGGPVTVTHPEITRYFMLIPEACKLVLQAAAIGQGRELFILDMGKPIKILDLAKKMIELSGRSEVKIEFSGLRPGEKLYEELLTRDSDLKTKYESITVASPTFYPIEKLNKDIERLIGKEDKLSWLKKIVPEFNHQPNKP